MGSATGHVVPATSGTVTGLARAKLFQVIGRCHTTDVEEIFVLTDTPGTRFGALTFGGYAINGDLCLVDGNGSSNADLRTELVHQIHVRVEAEVARVRR